MCRIFFAEGLESVRQDRRASASPRGTEFCAIAVQFSVEPAVDGDDCYPTDMKLNHYFFEGQTSEKTTSDFNTPGEHCYFTLRQ